MSTIDILARLQKKLGITMYRLNKRLKLKSANHVGMLMSGKKKAGIATVKKIMKLCEEEGIKVKLDDFD